MERAQYRVVTYRAEYRAQVLEVQKDLWGPHTELNAAYLDWKHVHNPYVSEPLIYLAMHGERVVGMYSFVGAKWEFGSPRQTLVLPLASDVVIAPDHRNRGLVSLVRKAALKDLAEKCYSYVLSMGTRPTVLMSSIRAGWQSVGSLRPVGCTVTQRKSLPHLRALVKKSRLAVSVYRKLCNPVWKSPPNQFDLLDRIGDQRNGKLGDHVSIGKVPRILEMTRLRSRLDKDSRIRHVQDEGYYAWRLQNPRSNYRFLFWDDAELQGYVVLRATAYLDVEPIGVIDWGATSEKAQAELLQAAIQLTCGQTLVTWSATLTERERSILEAAGFESLPQAIIKYPWVAAVRPVREEMLNQEWRLGDQPLLDIGNWDFRMLHSRAF